MNLDHRERLFELGSWVAEHAIDGDGPIRAARNLLIGHQPRVGQAEGERLSRPEEPHVDAGWVVRRVRPQIRRAGEVAARPVRREP